MTNDEMHEGIKRAQRLIAEWDLYSQRTTAETWEELEAIFCDDGLTESLPCNDVPIGRRG